MGMITPHLHGQPEDHPTLLVIDDEEGLRDMVQHEIPSLGYRVTTAPSGEEAIALARERSFDLILCDLLIPGMGGIAAIRELKKISPRTEVVVATGSFSLETVVECMRLGAYNYILKPYELSQIHEALSKALAHGRGVLAFALLLAAAAPAAASDRNDFLFLLEEAYVQTPGELQLDAVFSASQDRSFESSVNDEAETTEVRGQGLVREGQAALEYGLTKTLELDIDVSGSRRVSEEREEGEPKHRVTSDGGEAELGLKALLLEEGTWPALSASGGMSGPYGNAGLRGARYIAGLSLSRDFGPWILHLGTEGSLRPGATRLAHDGVRSRPADLGEVEAGVALVRRLPAGFKTHLEVRVAGEDEIEDGERTYEKTLQVLPGQSYQWSHGEDESSWQFGVGGLVTMGHGLPSWGGMAKVQWEFDL
jgi:CheY-like chemotaxis protein